MIHDFGQFDNGKMKHGSGEFYYIDYCYRCNISEIGSFKDSFKSVPKDDVGAVIRAIHKKHGDDILYVNWVAMKRTHYEQTMDMIDYVIGVVEDRKLWGTAKKLKELKEHLTTTSSPSPVPHSNVKHEVKGSTYDRGVTHHINGVRYGDDDIRHIIKSEET